MKNNYTINIAKTMTELYTLMQNNTGITPLAGTTGLLKDCRTDRFVLPESI